VKLSARGVEHTTLPVQMPAAEDLAMIGSPVAIAEACGAFLVLINQKVGKVPLLGLALTE
jgi:hypothetical protein